MNPASHLYRNSPFAVVTGNLNLVRCLGRAGVPVFCATSEANRTAFLSRYVKESQKTPSPTQSPGDFVDALVEIAQNRLTSKAVLFYDGDGDLAAISEHRNRLGDYYHFLLPDHGLITALLDKRNFSRFAADRGLPVPKTHFIGDGAADFADLKPEDFPILVKPQTRVGWLDNSASWEHAQGGKAFSVDSRAQLDELLYKTRGFEGGMVLQQRIPGPESEIYSYHAFIDQQGEPLAEFCGRKHLTFPVNYGRSAFIQVLENHRLIELGRDCVKRTGVVGVVKLDYKYDCRTDTFYLLEINPRFSIWNWPGAIAGRNLPAIAYQVLSGYPDSKTSKPLKVVYWADGRAHRRAVGRSGLFWWHLPSYIGKTVAFNIWSFTDPLPFVAHGWYSVSDFVKRALRKLLRFSEARAR